LGRAFAAMKVRAILIEVLQAKPAEMIIALAACHMVASFILLDQDATARARFSRHKHP